MTFKEWTESRRWGYVSRLGAKMATDREFRHIARNTFEFHGEVIELPAGDTPDTDDHQAYAYLAGYLKWCKQHDQEPGPFEDLVETFTSEDL